MCTVGTLNPNTTSPLTNKQSHTGLIQIPNKESNKQFKEKQKTQQINNQCKLGKVSIPNMNTGHPVSHCPWLHPSDSCSVHSSLYPSFSWASGNAIIHVKIVSYRKLRVFSLISTQAPSSYYYLELRFNRTVQFLTSNIVKKSKPLHLHSHLSLLSSLYDHCLHVAQHDNDHHDKV